MAVLNIPVGQFTALGIAKEATFGVFVTPSLWHPYESFSPVGKNMPVKRPGARKRPGATFSATGPYDLAISLRPEPDPDTLGQLIVAAMGVQSTPAVGQLINTTLLAATTTGGTVLTLPVVGGPYPVGTALTVDTSTNLETVSVVSVAYSTSNPGYLSVTVSATTKNHSAGVAVTGLTTTAYVSTISFATAGAVLGMLPSYSLQYQRVIDAINYAGCCVDTMKLSQDSGKELQADFAFVGQTEALIAIGSAATPSFGTRMPMTMEAGPSSVYYKGQEIGIPEISSGATPALLKWDLSLNNGLNKSYRSIGTGRYVAGFPVGSRVGTGSLTLGFESNQAYKDWYGAAAAAAPQGAVNGIPLTIVSASQELADATNGVGYQMIINLPNVFPTQDPVPGKMSGELQQTFAFDTAETAGAANDIQITYVCTSNAAFQ